MIEIIVQVNLECGQILNLCQLATVCSTSKSAIGGVLKRRFTHTITTDRVHPNGSQGGVQPIEDVI